MSIWKWLNPKRLRDYPRLIFIASWAVLILNVLFHRGWIGGITGITIGGDFISNYSGGLLYQTDIHRLYDSTVQEEIQTKLVQPSESHGFAPFISPPYVALSMGWFTFIQLPYALLAWEILNLLCVVLTVYLISKYILPEQLSKNELPPIQLLLIILSSFAFVDGFLAGQSHGLTLFLCTAITVTMIKEKWEFAGVLAGFLLYKPQFVIGFLICWFLWGKYRALLSFGIITTMWQLPVILANGFAPYIDYLNLTHNLLYLPYAKDSFPISIMATPYALFSTIFPISYAKIIQVVFIFLDIVMVLMFSYIAFVEKSLKLNNRIFSFSLALLLPLIIAPHTLIYDLIILVPGLVLLARIKEISTSIKTIAIIIYLSLLLIPLVGYVMKLALTGIIPLLLFVYLLYNKFHRNLRYEFI